MDISQEIHSGCERTASVQDAPNATVKFENNNIDHGTPSNIIREFESPRKRRILSSRIFWDLCCGLSADSESIRLMPVTAG